MIKPTPEDFGLTPQDVAEAAQKKDRIENAVLFGFGSASVLLGIVVGGVMDVGVAGAVGYGFTFGIFGVLFVGLPLSLLVEPLLFRDYRNWSQAESKYEAWYRRTQVDFWMSLSGRSFEHEVAALLSKAGLGAEVTPASGDKGVDVVLGDGTLVQCKAHKARISPGAARELFGTLQHFNAPRGILISRSGFTTGVREFVAGKPIELWSLERLIAMQNQLTEGTAVRGLMSHFGHLMPPAGPTPDIRPGSNLGGPIGIPKRNPMSSGGRRASSPLLRGRGCP